MGCHFLLQGIFPTLGSNPGLQHRRQILSHQGSPNGLWYPNKLRGRVCVKSHLLLLDCAQSCQRLVEGCYLVQGPLGGGPKVLQSDGGGVGSGRIRGPGGRLRNGTCAVNAAFAFWLSSQCHRNTYTTHPMEGLRREIVISLEGLYQGKASQRTRRDRWLQLEAQEEDTPAEGTVYADMVFAA